MANIVVENNQKSEVSNTQKNETTQNNQEINNQLENSEEAKKAEEIKKLCQETVQQVDLQVLAEQRKILKKQVDDFIVQLGEIPVDLINSIYEVFTKLMKVVSGYTDPTKYDFDSTEVIDSIISALEPIIAGLTALPVPSVPGLPELPELLNKLKQAAANQDFPKKPDVDGKLPEIPQEIIEIIKDILTVIQSICTTLPMVMINVIFQMLNAIIGMFGQIAGVIGVPGIPFPLSLVPQCIELAPKIADLIINLPIRISQVIKNIIEKKIDIVKLSIPDKPENIMIPKPLPPCPDRDNVNLPSAKS